MLPGQFTITQRTMVIEGRLEAATMATLARYFEEFGTPARTKSDLLWQACELLCQLLVTNEKVEKIADLDTAFTYLTERFGSVNRGGRGRSNMSTALQMDAIQRDGLTIEHARKTKPVANRPHTSDEEMQAAALEAVEKLRAEAGPIVAGDSIQEQEAARKARDAEERENMRRMVEALKSTNGE